MMNRITYLLSEFDDDFDVLLNLPFKNQEVIYKKINPDIDCLFNQIESLSEAALTSVVSALARRAKDSRNQALRQGAIDKTDINWLSAALLEHTYNSILSGNLDAAQHISKKLMGWMQGMDMVDLNALGMTPLGQFNKNHMKVVGCPSCKSNFKVPINKHIEITCKHCSFKWKMHT